MTETPPPPPQQPEQSEAAFFSSIRGWGIMRSPHHVFGGVASGVGERIGLARVPARLILVVAGLVLSGIVLVAYAAAWALLPDRDGNIIIQNFGRGITNVGALIGIAIFGLIGAFNLDPGWGRNGLNIGWDSADVSGFGQYDGVLAFVFGFIAVGFCLLVVAGLIFAIVYSIRRSKGSGAPRSGPYAAPPTGGPHSEAVPEGTESTGDESVVVPEGTPAPPAAASPGQPQPWEAAVLPGDPAVTGATTASAAWNGHQGTVPPVPPRPPLRRVPGPGRRFYLITAAWLVISIAIIMVTNRIDGLAVAPGLAWLALFTVGFGLILAAIAVAGRKLGFLGFLSVPLLIAGLLVSINSGELREAYQSAADSFDNGNAQFGYWENGVHFDGDGNIISTTDDYGNVIDSSAASVDPTVADPTLAFADDYQEVYVAPQCYDWEQMQPGNDNVDPGFTITQLWQSQARISYTALESDTTVDVIAERTVLTIPANTNLILRADSDAQSTIDWKQRGLYCEFWDGSQDNLSVINAGAPTLTLVVHDDQFANTIEVHETPVVEPTIVAPEPAASPQPSVTPEGK